MNSIDRKLLSRLERKSLITTEEKEALEARFDHCQGNLYQELLPMNIVNERELAKSYARACGLPFLDIRSIEPDFEMVKSLSREQRQAYQALPIGKADGKLIVAIWEATDVVQIDRLSRMVEGEEIQVVLTLPSALKHELDKFSLEELAEAKAPKAASRKSAESVNAPALTPKLFPEDSPKTAESQKTLHQLETLHESKMPQTLHEAETVIEDEATKTRRELETRFSLTKNKKLPQSSDEIAKIDVNNNPKPLESFLRHATLNRAEELEIDLSRLQSMICLRQDGAWMKLADLTYSEGKKMMSELTDILNPISKNDQTTIGTIDFTEKGKRQRTIVHHVSFHDREHLRILFPANLVLLQRPIRLLGQQPEIKTALEPLLTGQASSMVTVSCADEIALRQMVASLGFFSSSSGCQVESVSWLQGLSLPKTKDRAPLSAEEFGTAISQLTVDKQNFLAIAHEVPDNTIFEAFSRLSSQGGKLASFLSRDLVSSLAVLEPLKPSLHAGHLHLYLWRLPKLCQNCKELNNNSKDAEIPNWILPLQDHDLHDAPGCNECGNRGTKGSVWVSHLLQLNEESAEFEPLIDFRQTLRTSISEGLISLDEVLTQFPFE